MTISIFSKGKEYISASRGAEETGYTSDYIGQLCRAGKIPSKLIGRTWYVDLDTLLEHKKGRRLGRAKKESFEPVEVTTFQIETPKSLAEKVFSYEKDFRATLPRLKKVSPQVLRHSRLLLTEIAAVTLVFVITLTLGLSALENSFPRVAMSLEERVEKISQEPVELVALVSSGLAHSQLANVSLFGFLSKSVDFLASGYDNLKEIALSGLRLATTGGEGEKGAGSDSLPEVRGEEEEVKAVAVTQTAPAYDFATLRADLKAELENYVLARIGGAKEPINIYQSFNTTVLREEILLADTRPSVRRQSDADSGRLSSAVSALTDGGSFVNATLSNSSIAGPTGSFTNLSFSLATGTSATTTSFFSTTASSTNLFAAASTLGELIFNNGTSTQSFALTGNGAGLTFYGTGNHDITAAAGTLRIGANTIIGNILALDDTVDIGDAGTRFDKIYANEVNATTLVGTISGGNVSAETLSINSDNTSADTENGILAFERGSVSPNALLTWNATLDQFEFNNSLLISGNSTTTNATTTNSYFSNSLTGPSSFTVNSSGNVGIGTVGPSTLLHIATEDSSTSTALPVLRLQRTTTGTAATGIGVRTEYYSENDSGTGVALGYMDAIYHNAGNDHSGFAWTTRNSSTLAERMRLAGRDLAIGTTNAGLARLRAHDSDSSASAEILASDDLGTAYIGFAGSNTSINPTIGTNANHLAFFTGGSGTFSTTERVRIDSSGNVGIGTTTPWATLAVNPVAGAASNQFVVGSSTATNFIINNSGNVGIGTTNPVEELHLFRNTNSSLYVDVVNPNSGSSAKAAIALEADSKFAELFVQSSTNTSTAPGAGVNSFNIYTNSDIAAFHTSGTERMRISSGNVGIGTTNPGGKLDVRDGEIILTDADVAHGLTSFQPTAAFGALSAISGTAGGLVVRGVSDTDALGLRLHGVIGAHTNTAAGIELVATKTNGGNENTVLGSTDKALGIDADGAGTYELTILGSGNVGIGTEATAAKFHINNTSSTASGVDLRVSRTNEHLFMRLEALTAGKSPFLIFASNQGSSADNTLFSIRNISTRSGSDVMNVEIGAWKEGSAADDKSYVGFSTYDSSLAERMRITSTGKVGIGSTTPFALLGVENTGSGLSFAVNDAANDATPFVVDTSGNVGIGTAVPDIYKLYVYTPTGDALLKLQSAGTDSSAQMTFQNDAQQWNLFTDGSDADKFKIRDSSAGATMLTITKSTGNVGIGTTNPGSLLHLSSSAPILTLTDSDTGADATINPNSSAGSLFIYADTNNEVANSTLNLGVDGSDYLTINSSGNVGIGITNPSSKLHVTTDDATTNDVSQIILIDHKTTGTPASGIGSAIYFRAENSAGNAAVGAQVAGILTDVTSGSEDGELALYTRADGGGITERVRIDENGNVGIGTTTPQWKTQISGTGAPQLTLSDSGLITSNHWSFRNSNGFLYFATSSPTSFATSTNPALMIDGTTGYLGIGVTNPGAPLEVSASGLGDIVHFSLSGGSERLKISADSNDSNILTGNGNNLKLGTSGSGVSMTILSSTGNVGIGTTNPAAHRLHIVNDSGGLQVERTDGQGLIDFYNSQTAAAGNVGNLRFYGKNSVGDREIYTNIEGESVDVTDGSEDGALAFMVRQAGEANPSEKMRINSSGNVGIGTTNPGSMLTVAAGVEFDGIANGVGTAYLCQTLTTGVVSTSTSACNPSSLKYKENIEELAYGLEEVLNMRPVSYDYKKELLVEGHQVGFLAEEMYQVIPEVVGLKDGEPDNIDYAKLTSVLVKAIKDLYTEFTELKNTVLAFAERMVSKEIVATERLCVGSTCINEEQLIGLLQQSGQGYTTTSPSPEATAEQSGGNGEEGETTVEEPVAEESAPEPEPEPEPESQPETETQPEPNEGNGVEGEVTGEGEPASDPVAESSSEPAPEG